MYMTEVFLKNACKIDTANILYINGIIAQAEKDGKIFDATYDYDYKMFVIDDNDTLVSTEA